MTFKLDEHFSPQNSDYYLFCNIWVVATFWGPSAQLWNREMTIHTVVI